VVDGGCIGRGIGHGGSEPDLVAAVEIVVGHARELALAIEELGSACHTLGPRFHLKPRLSHPLQTPPIGPCARIPPHWRKAAMRSRTLVATLVAAGLIAGGAAAWHGQLEGPFGLAHAAQS